MVTISDLPEHIRHHILSFLPTADAMATAQLSKSWKHDWLTLPCLNFDLQFFKQSSRLIRKHYDNLTRYAPFLNRILKRRAALRGCLSNSHCLKGLSLFLPDVTERPSLLADKLLDFAFLSFKVEALELIQPFSVKVFRLESLSHMNAHTLKSLSLYGIQVNQCIMDILATGCPFLEVFALRYCYVSDPVFEIHGLNKLTDLIVACEKSKMFSIGKLVMNLPRLESLYCAKKFLDFDMDIVSSPHLKNLTLNRESLNDGLLERLLLCLPSLERLDLQLSCISGRLRIVNHSLKHLILKLNLVNLIEFCIVAPNLEHFIYYHIVTEQGGIDYWPMCRMDNFTLKKATVELNPRDLKDKRLSELLGEINQRSKYMEVRMDWMSVFAMIERRFDCEPCCEIREVVLLNCSSATFQDSHGVDAALSLFPNAETVKTETGQVLHRRS